VGSGLCENSAGDLSPREYEVWTMPEKTESSFDMLRTGLRVERIEKENVQAGKN